MWWCGKPAQLDPDKLHQKWRSSYRVDLRSGFWSINRRGVSYKIIAVCLGIPHNCAEWALWAAIKWACLNNSRCISGVLWPARQAVALRYRVHWGWGGNAEGVSRKCWNAPEYIGHAIGYVKTNKGKEGGLKKSTQPEPMIPELLTFQLFVDEDLQLPPPLP